MGRARIDRMFDETRAAGRAAFLPFMTAGLPDPERSPQVFAALARAGADGFEVGIPYSDPLMDGPVIQRASDSALSHGSNFDASFRVLSQVSDAQQLPSLAMTYANPVFRKGVDAFCERLQASGSDGVIVPDLPVEESGPLRQAAARHGLGVVLFVAPTSDQRRIETVAQADPAFIYAVAEMGVTGVREESSGLAAGLVERIRGLTDAPIVFGVGISNPAQAAAAARAGADGVIVGTALVAKTLDADDFEQGLVDLESFARSLATSLDR
jgi:tryptophan synthase alpha chain